MNTKINDEVMSWGGENGLAPKHPARNKPAMPSRKSYWDEQKNIEKSGGVPAYPGGSKSESEFWCYLMPADRPGHGTGVKPGLGKGYKPVYGKDTGSGGSF
ncbi:MAG: hypothetical protein OQJ84_05570 [Xanthomonadales bacterium]|nr:hypothetical protein [Xanthomonadales bacterium]